MNRIVCQIIWSCEDPRDHWLTDITIQTVLSNNNINWQETGSGSPTAPQRQLRSVQMGGRLPAVVFLLSCLLETHEGFRHSARYHRYLSCREASSNFGSDFETLSSICRNVAVTTNSTATLINFIQLGDSWAMETNKKSSSEFDRFKKGDKVPGCMADVRITTSFDYSDGFERYQSELVKSESVVSPDPTITIDGSADSRVAQGILALLCKVRHCRLDRYSGMLPY